MLSDGWFRGQIGITRAADQWGDRLALLAQLELTHDDGSVDRPRHRPRLAQPRRPRGRRRPDRRPARGPAAAAARLGRARLRRRGLDAASWSVRPRVRRARRLARRRRCAGSRSSTPVSVTRLGRRPAGRRPRPEHQRLGPADRPRPGRHPAHADPRRVARRRRRRDHRPPRARPCPSCPSRCRPARSTRWSRPASPGEVFEPRHTTHGFQYVRDRGPPGDLDARRRHRRRRAHRPAAHRLVRLQRRPDQPAARGRGLELPRQRLRHPDRLPAPRARRLDRRLAALSSRPPRSSTTWPASRTKWLRDVAADQWPDGTIANISPAARSRGPRQPDRLPQRLGRLGRRRGHRPVGALPGVRRHRASSPSCGRRWSAWLDRTERMARDGRHPCRVARRPEPAAHEQYLWDTGFHWGEWLVPGRGLSGLRCVRRGRQGRRGDRVLRALRRADGPDRRGARPRPATRRGTPSSADRVRAAWQAEYLDADGRLHPDTQANHVRALAFDLVPDRSCAPAVADRLVELVRAGRHPPGHRLPGHAVPAAGAGRHRPPRRRLRAAAAGHRAVLADDDRPRRDHHVGALGRRRRRRRRRTSRSTTTPRARSSRSCTATSPASSCSTTGRPTAGSGSGRGPAAA